MGSVMSWSDEMGGSGEVRLVWSDERADISLMRLIDPLETFAAHLSLAKDEPNIGDDVFIIGFDKAKDLADITVATKVLEKRGRNLIYEKTPGPGSSGSCVLNTQGEVVAINVAMGYEGRGLGVLVSGKWRLVPDEFKKFPKATAEEPVKDKVTL
jgi:S1-C subfamily serine protease